MSDNNHTHPADDPDYMRNVDAAKVAWETWTANSGQIPIEDQPDFIVMSEMMDFFHANPEFTGAFLMALLPNEEQLNVHSKVFWLRVAHAMGPDWVRAFKEVSLHMTKVV